MIDNNQTVYHQHRRLAEGEPSMRLHMDHCDEVNHGMHKYMVDLAGEVTVPPECGRALLGSGAGATWIDKPQEPELSGTVRVKHIEDAAASFSWRNETFLPDEGGVLVVPVAAVGDAACHGFLTIAEPIKE